MMARAKEAGKAMRESTIRGEILPSLAARGCGTHWQFPMAIDYGVDVYVVAASVAIVALRSCVLLNCCGCFGK